MFSILIPTFNNIDYLKLCIESIRKNSKFNHQIILHINEGSDGTLDYVKKSNTDEVGYYNGGCLWTKNKDVPNDWRYFTKKKNWKIL